MPYQNDMSSLADIVSPVDAAMQAGQQGGYANLQSAAENAVKQATIPAEEQAPYLKNLFTAAQTASERGLAQQQQAKGTVDTALVPGQIGAGTSENQGKITSAHVEQLQNLGQVVGGVADQMESIPAMVRPAMMNQMLDQFGVTDPSIRQMVADGNPDNLRKLSQAMFSASDKARQTALGENIKGGYQLGAQQIAASGKVQAADISAEARRQVAAIQQATREALAPLGALQQQIYAKVANGTATPAERAALDSMNKVQQLTRQGMPFQAGITGTQVESNVPAVPNTTPAQPQGQPSTPSQPATVEDAVSAEMRKRGLLQ